MTDLRLWEIRENTYEIDVSCVRIGKVTVTENPFHAETCHISLMLDEYDIRLAHPLCELLRAEFGKPLQVMLYSWETEKSEFLLQGGFHVARRCYEVEFTAATSPFPTTEYLKFSLIHKGNEGYEACCRSVYEHYERTHQGVSPLTASFDEFCEELPDTVICEKTADSLRHAAFIAESDEDMEIAYVASEDEASFACFAEKLLSYLSVRAVKVCFECDDCDPLAMMLLNVSGAESEESYDTYILN